MWGWKIIAMCRQIIQIKQNAYFCNFLFKNIVYSKKYQFLKITATSHQDFSSCFRVDLFAAIKWRFHPEYSTFFSDNYTWHFELYIKHLAKIQFKICHSRTGLPTGCENHLRHLYEQQKKEKTGWLIKGRLQPSGVGRWNPGSSCQSHLSRGMEMLNAAEGSRVACPGHWDSNAYKLRFHPIPMAWNIERYIMSKQSDRNCNNN